MNITVNFTISYQNSSSQTPQASPMINLKSLKNLESMTYKALAPRNSSKNSNASNIN